MSLKEQDDSHHSLPNTRVYSGSVDIAGNRQCEQRSSPASIPSLTLPLDYSPRSVVFPLILTITRLCTSRQVNRPSCHRLLGWSYRIFRRPTTDDPVSEGITHPPRAYYRTIYILKYCRIMICSTRNSHHSYPRHFMYFYIKHHHYVAVSMR